MMRRSLRYLMVWGLGALAGSLAMPTWAAFSSSTTNQGARFVAAADWVAPQVAAAVIRKAEGGVDGYVRPSGGYFVYASVTDSGNPPTGIASVKADVSELTSGSNAVSMAAGSWTVGGTAYNYRSSQLTADAVLVDGPAVFAIATGDAGGNTRTAGGFAVLLDGVIPAATDTQTENKPGGGKGKAEEGDAVLYVYSEQLEPQSLVPGWSGNGTTHVVVKIIDNVQNDKVEIWDDPGTGRLPLGTIETGGNYVTSTATFGASGTRSRMTQEGSTIRVVLGSHNGGNVRANSDDTLLWLPSASATDLAGNGCSPVGVYELGLSDPDF